MKKEFSFHGAFLVGIALVGLATIFSYGENRGVVLGDDTMTYSNTTSGGSLTSSTGSLLETTIVKVSDTTPPTRPSNLSARGDSLSGVTLSWSPSSDDTGVVGYALYRNGSVVKTLTGTYFLDTGVHAGESYGYYVIAGDAAGNKSEKSSGVSITIPKLETNTLSNTDSPLQTGTTTTTTSIATATPVSGDSIAPSRPSNFSITILDQRTVQLKWTASLDNIGVVGYRIFKNGTPLSSVTGTTFKDISLYVGQEYRYFIKARDAAGNESSGSEEIKVFIPKVTVDTGTSVTSTTWVAEDNGDTLIVKSASEETSVVNTSSEGTFSGGEEVNEDEKIDTAKIVINEDMNSGLVTENIDINGLTSKQIASRSELRDLDFDRDGLSNAEEGRLGTDPYVRDSDHDGFADGDEVQSGHDPKKFSPGDGRDKVVREDVKDRIIREKSESAIGGTEKKEDSRYRVEKVEIVKADAPDKKDIVRFSGKAVPNTYITLYVYSTPRIVTVKTDIDGNWSYDLAQDLEDGTHEVYVAVTDNTGKVSTYGSGLGFVKTADAITVRPIAEAAESPIGNQSPLERSQLEYFFVAFIAILFFSGAALIVVSRKSSIGVE